MFLINKFFFLLTNDLSAQEFATQESSKLIIPGIIFSVGAVMLIACVIYSNYTRRKKLQEAERLKRERIKKFSEEANIRYSDMPQAENGVYKSKRIVTDTPESSGFNPAAIAQQAQNVSQPVAQQAVPTFTQTMPNAQVMPSMSAAPDAPQVQPLQQAPAQPAAPATSQVMPSAPGMVSNYSNSTAPQNNTVQTPVMPTQVAAPKPQGMSMGSQVLPGMDATQTVVPDQGEKFDNIAELVRKRVQEVENQKRNEAAGIKTEDSNKEDAPQEKTPQKEEAPKRKFEYVPEFKPGEGPKKEEPKEEKKEETPKEENENHLFEKSVYDEDQNKDEEPKAKTVEQLRLERPEDIAKKRMDDETQSMITQAESGKVQKVLVERSEAFVEEDEKAVSKKIQEEAEPVKVERKPVIPKVTSKKSEMDRGLVREVQAKLDSTREYEKAIELKEAEKEKLKEEYLQKRLHLEAIKKRLKEEGVIDDEKQVKLSREQISRNLLDNVEKGVTYQQGMKVSLMDMPDPDAERVIMPDDYEEPKTEETPVEEKVEEQPVQEVKIEVPEPETKIETPEPEVKAEPVIEETKPVFENTQKEEVPEVKLEPEVPEVKEETLHEEITKVNDNVPKENKGVLNSLESMFGALDDDAPQPAPVQKQYENQRVYNPNETFELEQRRTEKKVDPREQKEGIKNLFQKAKDMPNNAATSAASILNARLLSQATSNKAREEQVKKDQENILDKHRMKQARDLQNQKMNVLPKNVENENVKPEIQEEKPKRVKLDLEKHIEENKPKQKSILEGVNLEKEILYEKSVKTFTGLESAPDHKKIIAVISPAHCGKTTIAVNLAYELANSGISTCLIDTDNEKKDVYYYINKQIVGSMSRLVECEEPEDMYKLGIPVKDNLIAFTDNKGISYDINYSKLYKLIAYAHEKNEAVIIDVKNDIKSETLKDILNLSTNICIVVDTKPSTLSQIADKFARVKSAFINKDVIVACNMDEGRSASKSSIRNVFKRLEYRDGGMRKQYYIKTSDIFSVEYDTKAIIQGLITQEPAVTVKDNNLITDISKIASHYYNV